MVGFVIDGVVSIVGGDDDVLWTDTIVRRNPNLTPLKKHIDGISSANLECVCTHCRQCKSHLLTITEVRLRFRYSLLLASFDSETVRSWQS